MLNSYTIITGHGLLRVTKLTYLGGADGSCSFLLFTTYLISATAYSTTCRSVVLNSPFILVPMNTIRAFLMNYFIWHHKEYSLNIPLDPYYELFANL